MTLSLQRMRRGAHPFLPPRISRFKPLAAAVLALAAGAAQAVDYAWSTGNFVPGSTAPDPLPASDSLNIVSGGLKSFVSTAWTSQGGVAWQTDPLYGGSATVTNQGLWDAQSDSNQFVYNTGNRPTFVNSGEFRKSAGSFADVGSWQFTNDGGVINAQSGVINFNSQFTAFNSGSSFTGAGTVRVSSGAGFSGNFLSDNLEIAGGTNGGSSAQLSGGSSGAGQMTWSGGTLSGGWALAGGTTLTATSGGTHQLTSASFDNNGEIFWQANGNLFGGSSTLTNNGLFEAQADAAMQYNIGNRPEFNNAATGTLRAASGVNFTNLSFNFVNDGGILEAGTGAQLVFGSGFASFNDGTRFSGDGSNRVTNSATFSGTYTSENLLVEGGTLSGNGAVAQGITRWSGGTMTGSWQLASGHALQAIDGGIKQLTNFDVTNDGEILWQSTERLFGGSGKLTNNGLFEVQADAAMQYNIGNRPEFNNAATGTLRVADGVSFTNQSFSLVNDGGVLEAGAGAELIHASGITQFNHGTRFAGEGSNRVTNSATFSGSYASDNLLVEGGTLSGNGAVAQGVTRWSGGTLTGSWQLASGHTLQAIDGGIKQLTSFDVTNNGNMLWQTTDTLFGGSGKLTNNGLFEVQADAAMQYNIGNRPEFNNAATGILRVADGVSFTNHSFNFTNDGGIVEAGAGAEMVFASGVATFNDGTRFVGEGSSRVTSNATFSGAYTAENLLLEGGNQTGVAAVARGATTWAGGALVGTWELADGHELMAVDGAAKQLVSGSLTNYGAIVWQSSDNLSAGSSTLNNQGRLEFRSDADVAYTVGNRPTLANSGTIRKTGGSGETSLAAVNLSNLGTIDVQSGSIRLPNGFTNAGTLTGTGSFSTSVLTNAGHVAPGGATPAALTIDGSFVQGTGGVLDIALTDLTSISQLLVNGTAMLDGTLALSCAGNCRFAVNDEFLILDSIGDLSGVFGNVTLSGFQTGAFDVIYDYGLDEVRLLVTEQVSAVPLPAAAWLFLSALGVLGVGARSRRNA